MSHCYKCNRCGVVAVTKGPAFSTGTVPLEGWREVHFVSAMANHVLHDSTVHLCAGCVFETKRFWGTMQGEEYAD